MAVYAWQGVDAAGKNVKGVKDADNPRNLRLALRREGTLVTEVLEEAAARKKKGKEIDFRQMFRRISATDIALTTRQLATLLAAGIPLVEALSAMIEQLEHPDLQSAFTQTRDKVNEGTSLAEAMRAHPKVFTTLYVNMVAAGEASGTLETVLSRLADFLDAQAKLRSEVSGALAYPAFMAVLSIGIIALMMTVVVPKVTRIFADFEQSLPIYTKVLIFVSDLVSGYWYLILLTFAGAIYWFRRWVQTEAGRKSWDLKVLRIPLFGNLFLMVAVTRFARTLATLLRSGVPVLSAMDITRNVIGNTELMRVIDLARDHVREGESLAKPLKDSGRFPPIVTHMIAIGERSGQLEEMLEHVASAYDQQVDARVRSITSLLEPVMIIVLGGVAGFIAFAILMPLLQINQFVR
jgi:general secretion pathway protein F